MNIRLFIFWLMDILGINALLRTINRYKAVILWYHGICDDNFDLLKGYDERHISKSSFREQMEYLKRKGYSFLTMTEFVSTIKNKGKFHKNIVLTFDDGFKNVIKNAYPIMQEYNAKGCFYLVSDLTGTDNLLWTDYVETLIRNQKQGSYQFDFKGKKYTYIFTDKKSYEKAMQDIKSKLRSISNTERLEHLKQFGDINIENAPKEFALASWEEVKELDPNVLEIGCHTRSHPNCTNLISDEELQNEIYHSKMDIENKTERKVEHFCYPAGSYDDRVIEKVISSGYQSAVTIDYGFNSENTGLYRLKRVEASPSLQEFKARVSGSISFIKRLIKILQISRMRKIPRMALIY
ncbi:MAG: polysaccharide deacetylase family protein [Dehalococcoidia bacterium]|nr:MAG: polysaccharide deacetylase family protein [Dehalococcoidia bacterium]